MSEFKLIPISGTNNRVYVQIPPKKEKVSAGGIIIPGSVTDEQKPKEGVVIAVSELDNNGKAPNVKVGDYVFFSPFAGQETEFEGQFFLTMKESDIHAKLKQ